MDLKKLFTRIVILSLAFLGSATVIMFVAGYTQYLLPVLTGWFISFLNAIAGSLILNKTLKEKGKGFINKVLGSLVVRMFSVLLLFFITVYFLKIEGIPLAVTMFFFYILFLMLELNFLTAATKKQTQGN